MAVPRRTLVLEQVAHCLTRLAAVQSVGQCADVLAGFLQALPLAWYALDLFGDTEARRRIFSNRCSRGFTPFVTRLGFLKRPDGVYQGTFADATLVLVKAGQPRASGRCLVCGVGLEKVSPLNDGPVLACVGALVQLALAHAWSIDVHARRQAMLEFRLADAEDVVMLIDGRGDVIDQAPASGSCPLPILPQIHRTPRPARGEQTAVATAGGRTFSVRSRWVASEKPLDGRFRVLHVHPQPAAPPVVLERLKRYGLSRREAQVAELVFTGISNQRIAETLFISPDTVKTHCRHIFGKLGISRRTEFLRVIGVDGHGDTE